MTGFKLGQIEWLVKMDIIVFILVISILVLLQLNELILYLKDLNPVNEKHFL